MSTTICSLDQTPLWVKQFCLNCLSGSFGADRKDVVDDLGLRTSNSFSMLGWDLAFTNFLAGHPGIICTKHKSGYWEYVLLYDPDSDFVFSFMRESRFKAIQKMPAHSRPIYVRALLSIANSVAAPLNQKKLFSYDSDSPQKKHAIIGRLNEICAQFQCEGVTEIKNHAFVIFSVDDGQISSLKACTVNAEMEVIESEEWLSSLAPDITPIVNDIAESTKSAKPMPLTEKAKNRRDKKTLVKPKIIETKASDE